MSLRFGLVVIGGAWLLTGCSPEKKNLTEASTLFKSELATVAEYGALVKSPPGKDIDLQRITVLGIHGLSTVGASARDSVPADSKNPDALALQAKLAALDACDDTKLKYFSDDLEARRTKCAAAISVLEATVTEQATRARAAGLNDAFPHLDGSAPEAVALGKQLDPLRKPTAFETAWDNPATTLDAISAMCGKSGADSPDTIKTVDDIVAMRTESDYVRCIDLMNARVMLAVGRGCKTSTECWRKACVDTTLTPPPGTPPMLVGTMSNPPNGAPYPVNVPACVRAEYTTIHVAMKSSCW